MVLCIVSGYRQQTSFNHSSTLNRQSSTTKALRGYVQCRLHLTDYLYAHYVDSLRRSLNNEKMTSQLLASELGNLIQESKRKHNDLRQVGYRCTAASWLVRKRVCALI